MTPTEIPSQDLTPEGEYALRKNRAGLVPHYHIDGEDDLIAARERLEARVAEAERVYPQVDDVADVLCKYVTERQWHAIRLRLWGDASYTEIGQALGGLSRQAAHQLVARAFRNLRREPEVRDALKEMADCYEWPAA